MVGKISRKLVKQLADSLGHGDLMVGTEWSLFSPTYLAVANPSSLFQYDHDGGYHIVSHATSLIDGRVFPINTLDRALVTHDSRWLIISDLNVETSILAKWLQVTERIRTASSVIPVSSGVMNFLVLNARLGDWQRGSYNIFPLPCDGFHFDALVAFPDDRAPTQVAIMPLPHLTDIRVIESPRYLSKVWCASASSQFGIRLCALQLEVGAMVEMRLQRNSVYMTWNGQSLIPSDVSPNNIDIDCHLEF